jgi:uncharacterized small protein (DUF1192 family)
LEDVNEYDVTALKERRAGLEYEIDRLKAVSNEFLQANTGQKRLVSAGA